MLLPLVSQVFLYGDSLKSCTVAVIVPEMGKVKHWARENGADENDLKKVIKDAAFKKYLLDELGTLAKKNKLTGLEKPRDVFITDEPFSEDNKLLTPTFKLKRNIAAKYFKPQIDAMYSKQQ